MAGKYKFQEVKDFFPPWSHAFELDNKYSLITKTISNTPQNTIGKFHVKWTKRKKNSQVMSSDLIETPLLVTLIRLINAEMLSISGLPLVVYVQETC